MIVESMDVTFDFRKRWECASESVGQKEKAGKRLDEHVTTSVD